MFVVRHVVCGVTSGHLDFLPILLPFVLVVLSPFFLLLPVFDTIWERLWRHLYHYAGLVPDLIFEARVLPYGRLAGPLANGRVILAISVVIVDFDDFVLRELHH